LKAEVIRRLRAESPTDVAQYWQVRNQGLKGFPDAFTTSYEEGVATMPEKLAKRFGGENSDDFVIGAFSATDRLLGCTGFERETRAKQHHKGKVLGMYVIPDARGTGLARKILAALLLEAKQLNGLEQIVLSVTHSNEGARSLYISMGFVSFGIERNAIKVGQNYYDKEFMALSLTNAN
jgi:ribosomal protein S18 acetylase RimI-like enzyme